MLLGCHPDTSESDKFSHKSLGRGPHNAIRLARKPPGRFIQLLGIPR
jgi:hypothetical protein